MGFTKGGTAPDKFDKEYAYGVRYNYGKEGRRTDWNAYSGMKIIKAGTGEDCGCPFRRFDADQLSATLRKKSVSSAAIAEIVGLVKGHHYQVACKKYYGHMHGGVEAPEDVGNHPNGYFKASQEHYNKDQPKAIQDQPANITKALTEGAGKAVAAV